MTRRRLRLRRPRHHDEIVELEPAQLTGLFALPEWLRSMGMIAWLTTGVIVLLVGLVWLLSLANTIVMPLIAAGIVASVASPVVRWLNGKGLPRAAGAGLVLLAFVVLGAGLTVAIVAGVTAQTDDVGAHLAQAKDTVAGWLRDLGVDPSQATRSTDDAGSSGSAAVAALLHGVAKGVAGLSGLVFFFALTVLSLFFLLKDGPTIRAWTERALPVPLPVAASVTGRVLQSLRGYFFGVGLIAAYNAVVVGLGGFLLGVPSLGTIVVVTFVGGFVPYLGAWAAGIFAFLIALGAGGPSEAAGMAVVLLLANGVLQQLVQPFAYGAALGIHPLAVLVVTIGGGAIFGAVGLVLAAPLTAAAVRVAADVARARAAAETAGTAEPAATGPSLAES